MSARCSTAQLQDCPRFIGWWSCSSSPTWLPVVKLLEDCADAAAEQVDHLALGELAQREAVEDDTAPAEHLSCVARSPLGAAPLAP